MADRNLRRLKEEIGVRERKRTIIILSKETDEFSFQGCVEGKDRTNGTKRGKKKRCSSR